MNTTDTPLTDESAYTMDWFSDEEMVPADFARDLERKLTICRQALLLRDHEVIPEQTPRAGSLLVDDGSTRRRVYVNGLALKEIEP